MKNHKTSSRESIQVESVLEVRICTEMWDRIKWVAARRESSYSWVVRYAMFRLIKRIDPKRCVGHIGNPRFLTALDGGLNQRAWARRTGASMRGDGAKHRHRLCLYGEDELAVRYTAAYYGCTMTHLIRVALELHFERLYASMVKGTGAPAMSALQSAFWFWLGIKHYRAVEFHSKTVENRTILFRRYRRRQYRKINLTAPPSHRSFSQRERQ